MNLINIPDWGNNFYKSLVFDFKNIKYYQIVGQYLYQGSGEANYVGILLHPSYLILHPSYFNNLLESGDNKVSNCIDPYYQKTRPEEQKLYQHFIDLVQAESPSQMIGRCRALFIEGLDYPETEILLILDTITASTNAAQDFKFFLNRCCHILINRWHMQPQLHNAIPELIALFESSPSRFRIPSFRQREISRLRQLIQLFTQSEQYLTLRRLAQVMTQQSDVNSSNSSNSNNSSTGNKPLVTLIHRYPYLYEHCLLGEQYTSEHQQTVRNIQTQVQKKFEIDLSQYVTYQVRRTQILKHASAVEANRILRPVNNPTLLSDRELNATLKQFIGKVENGCTYNDLAQKFLYYTRQTTNFRAFKDDLYEYLISSVDWEYGKRQFNQRLYSHLHNTLPQANSQKVDEFLLVRTCSQLLSFLVVESQLSPQHFTFIDLVSNQGTILTTGLLLKIVLICRKIKPYLEKRLAILFNHYESATTSGVEWLVQALEELNIALSLYFGEIDLSYFKQIC
jgi:hypothetical protein